MKKSISILALSCAILASLASCDGTTKTDSSTSDVTTTIVETTSLDSGDIPMELTATTTSSVTTTSSNKNSTYSITTGQSTGLVEDVVGKSHFTEELMDEISASEEFTINMDYSNDDITGNVYITTDGKSSYMEMDVYGFKINELTTDTGIYIIDNDNMRYYKIDDEVLDIGDIVSELVDMDLVYMGTDKAELSGVSYFRENFDNGACYYYDAESFDLKYITMDNVTIPIKEFSSKANNDKLKVPSEYREMTEEELQSWYEESESAIQ